MQPAKRICEAVNRNVKTVIVRHESTFSTINSTRRKEGDQFAQEVERNPAPFKQKHVEHRKCFCFSPVFESVHFERKKSLVEIKVLVLLISDRYHVNDY
jgi:hypothetical protein